MNITLTRGGEQFETSGKVMYVSPGLGMGIKFDEPVDAAQLATLSRWLDNAGNLQL